MFHKYRLPSNKKKPYAVEPKRVNKDRQEVEADKPEGNT